MAQDMILNIFRSQVRARVKTRLGVPSLRVRPQDRVIVEDYLSSFASGGNAVNPHAEDIALAEPFSARQSPLNNWNVLFHVLHGMGCAYDGVHLSPLAR